MLSRWVGGLMFAVGIGVCLLRWLAGRPAYHRVIQRRVAPAEDPIAARRIAQALAFSLVGPERSILAAWHRHQAPADALVDRAVRHLTEVRTLLLGLKVAGIGGLVVATAIAANGRSPRPVFNAGGWASLGCALVGGVASAGAFSGLFQAYHDRAYDSDDWQLPEDALLARLYPERFYQLAAIGWFGLWGLSGVLILAADRLARSVVKPPGLVPFQHSAFSLRPLRAWLPIALALKHRYTRPQRG